MSPLLVNQLKLNSSDAMISFGDKKLGGSLLYKCSKEFYARILYVLMKSHLNYMTSWFFLK